MYKQIVTLASISQLFNLAITDGQIVIIPKLVAVLLTSELSLTLICCHVTMCACTLLLFRHNALMLLACNFSHIMLCIIDSSLIVWALSRARESNGDYSHEGGGGEALFPSL